MPQITKIKPQKNKKRVNIYLDGKFGFGLNLESFVKFGLKVEQELSEKKIEKIVKEAEFQKVLEKLLKFATLRPRSEKEIDDWLRKHKVHKSLHKSLFNRLKRLNLVDDLSFTKWWVEQRASFRPRGERALRSELWKKGIAREAVEEVLSEIKIDEEKVARKLLEDKKYKWENLPTLEARKKMSDFLARKGFDWETVKKAIDAFFKKD